MIDSRCGLHCTGCDYKETCGCGGCIGTNGHPFHGECPGSSLLSKIKGSFIAENVLIFLANCLLNILVILNTVIHLKEQELNNAKNGKRAIHNEHTFSRFKFLLKTTSNDF